MKISEIITEGTWKKARKRKEREGKVFHVGNEHARIARTAKDAVEIHRDKDNGVIDGVDPHVNLEKVRDMYGMQLVDDFVDVLELPNGIEGTDDEMSMFSKDNR